MSNNKQYMYLVYYSQGVWDDHVDINIFVTHDEIKAQAYVNKFNTMLNKWKAYYKETVDTENAWKLAHIDAKVNRAYQIMEVNRAYIETIEIR
jgi:hypothetical protein